VPSWLIGSDDDLFSWSPQLVRIDIYSFAKSKSMLTFLPGMVLMFLAWTVVSSVYERTQDVKSAGYPQVVFVWLHAVVYSIAWSGLLVAYSLEILPYRLRAKGMMIMNLTVQAALVLGK
jgi:hypothetical protein